jgi:hypothetical protein
MERVIFDRGEQQLSKLTARNYLQQDASSSSDDEYVKFKNLKGYTIDPESSHITQSLI